MRVDAIEFDAAANVIADLAMRSPGDGEADISTTSRSADYVCAANVHMTMAAHDDPGFAAIVNAAALVVPDGVPMVWALRVLGTHQRRRVRVAPDLLLAVFSLAQSKGIKIGLYGGAPAVLNAFQESLVDAYPQLQLTYAWSPPFRALTPQEDERVVRQIRAAGVQLLLVGIGCPKQERWMAEHAGPGGTGCAMIGVGQAFDILGGRTTSAPRWMQDNGLEWLFRLAKDPRRLWKRYLYNNPRFILFFAAQTLRHRLGRGPSRSTS
jgi:N-acetylglucosaminyldiphosphoundecaprenol N-acetyl-beta-D-mannosaminyltransferase